jgi:hypothetical protein
MQGETERGWTDDDRAKMMCAVKNKKAARQRLLACLAGSNDLFSTITAVRTE